MTKRSLTGALILLATLVFSLAPLYRSGVEIAIPLHHILHAIMMAGAALAGIILAGPTVSDRRRGSVWLVVAMLAPVFAMLLMWPSKYSYVEVHPFGHILEHLALMLMGLLAGYGGQRYADGVGWASGIGIVAMGVLATWGYGVAPGGQKLVDVTPVAQSAAGTPDAARGATLYGQDCAACHGAQGGGGMGPSLKNERLRKPLPAAEEWIKNPAPPMPKLYPGTLSANDVADVAAYIETLH